MKKLIIITFSFLLTSNLFSQDYKWKSEINKIDSNGFYNIDIQLNILSKLNNNFNDIKIEDNKGKTVPYYIKKEPFSINKRVFKNYQIIEKIKWKNGATVLVVENKDKDTINNIQLQITNFDVRKHLELAGSDDYNNWYTIKENYLFRSANGLNTTSEIKSLNFPYTDYKYYRIIIYDVFSLPINVLKIGYYDTFLEQGKFKQLEKPTLTCFDSLASKQTYIKVSFKETPYLDKIIFKIAQPEYFYREARICLKKQDKKGRVYFQTLEHITLNSNTDLTFYQNDFSYKEFYIVIDNEDNPPLEKVEITAYQLNRYLVAYLESEKNYKLVFGNDKIQNKANYDIEHFKNRIGKNIQTISTGNIEKIQHKIKKKTTSSTLWMWGAIALVALLLGYMSYKMISEMEQNKSDEID